MVALPSSIFIFKEPDAVGEDLTADDCPEVGCGGREGVVEEVEGALRQSSEFP